MIPIWVAILSAFFSGLAGAGLALVAVRWLFTRSDRLLENSENMDKGPLSP